MRNPIVNRGVRGRLADQDESQPQPQRLQGAAKRLVAVEIVAEDGRLQVADVRAVPGQPRWATLSSQSCFSAPSWGCTNSGASAMTFLTLSLPGFTSTGSARSVEIRHRAVGVTTC